MVITAMLMLLLAALVSLDVSAHRAAPHFLDAMVLFQLC